MYNNHLLDKMHGLIVTNIDISDDDILITTEGNNQFRFYHDQECCESVYIYDCNDDLKVLENKKLESVFYDCIHNVDPDDITNSDQYRESFTWTNVYFVTNEKTVCVRWYGESNGYYNETIDIQEI